jgi:hypothetical protein
MRNLSLSLFQDTELLPLLLASVLITLVILLVFHHLPEWKQPERSKHTSALSFVKPTRNPPAWRKKDWRNLILISALYALVSFTRLGSMKMPVTTWQPSAARQSMTFELRDDTQFDAIYTFYGEGDNNSNPDTYQLGNTGMIIEGSQNGTDWVHLETVDQGSIYEYEIYEGNWNYRYIRFTSVSKNDTLTEIGFRAADHSRFLPVQVYEDEGKDSAYPASLVIDEQDLLVMNPTYYDEAYFDEIYHPRNAWEIANGQDMYATVHPLFGTNLIALSIHLFGNNPFAWRLPGALFGVLILWAVYGLCKLLFHKTSLASLGTLLCAADFMHLTTSRIATLEPFSVFFILLMFYWMIRYFDTSFYDTALKDQMKLLFYSGVFMGIGIATKWTACYSAIGLAILLFTNLITRFLEYRKASKLLTKPDSLSEEERQEALHIQEVFVHHTCITILLCFVFFIFIPAAIYWLSYLPDKVWGSEGWSIANVWEQNHYMYHYHTTLEATHPYQSNWYQWLLDARPIWYYYGTDAQGLSHSISCFSNPLLTWAGIPAMILVLVDLFTTKSRKAWIILVGYITALGPWVLFVDRCVFAYHFYPTSFFVILALVYAAQYFIRFRKGRIFLLVFCTVYVILFLAFLPATAGFGTELSFLKSLEWFPGWYFG